MSRPILSPIRRPVSHIVIHTAGAGAMKNGREVAVDQSAATIRDWHVRHNGWADIGYHFVVRFDGSIELGRPIEKTGAHVEGFNARTIGVCFAGHGDLQPFTTDQLREGTAFVAELLAAARLKELFLKNSLRVLGHRECNLLIPSAFPGPRTTKTCPGNLVDMAAFRRLVREKVGR